VQSLGPEEPESSSPPVPAVKQSTAECTEIVPDTTADDPASLPAPDWYVLPGKCQVVHANRLMKWMTVCERVKHRSL